MGGMYKMYHKSLLHFTKEFFIFLKGGAMNRSLVSRLQSLDIPVVLGIGVIHVMAIVAFAMIPKYFTWSGLVVCFALAIFLALLGINVCYHRLLTHASFKTPRWFKYVLTVIATMNWQGGPITWIGNHRYHHKHSDKEGDPHSPTHGFNSPTHGFSWAHVFWLFFKNPEGKDPKEAAEDLWRDLGIRFIDRYFWLPQFLLVPALFGLGAWYENFDTGVSWVLWGVGVRTFMTYHFTWFVNSAGHTWGYRNFDTPDKSTNNWWVAIVAFGEGWHNNHHHDQRSAAHGMRWFEFDPTYWVIKLMSYVGLAWDIKKPKNLPE